MNDLVSVIVPVYNVEKYLDNCIKSIIKQTYTNIEILLIDDGSTDKSSIICDNYLKIDERIKVIHKKNEGLSSARNYGLQIANGKYVMFVDSDDFIALDIIGKCIKKINNDYSDICCFAKEYIFSNSKKIVNNGSEFCENGHDTLKRMLIKDDIDNSACDKLFKKELFHNIRFPIGKYYEDIGTVYKLIMESNLVSHINDIGYYYVIRNNSITTEKFSDRQFDYMELSKEMIDNIEKKYNDLTEESEAFYCFALISIINKYNSSLNKEEFKNEMKKVYIEFDANFRRFLKNKCISFLKKVMLYLIHFKMYKVVLLIKRIIKKG